MQRHKKLTIISFFHINSFFYICFFTDYKYWKERTILPLYICEERCFLKKLSVKVIDIVTKYQLIHLPVCKNKENLGKERKLIKP